MSTAPHPAAGPKAFADRIQEQTGVHVARCYQCGKCSAGCPLASDMDYAPSLVLRMLQTGDPDLEKRVLRSMSIWLCLTCETCIARCPMEIDIPKMMDFLRQESMRQHQVNPGAKNIIAFHKAFLDSIQATGRLYEVGLIADFKVRSLKLTQDLNIAPSMFFKGKLPVFPEMIKDRVNLARIFKKTVRREEGI